ncbi:MAG: DUF4159 domain-containing protein [Myxococcales bacterium]|nr:DUF4159 domain-containing protein [Myxococcales bacterium]
MLPTRRDFLAAIGLAPALTALASAAPSRAVTPLAWLDLASDREARAVATRTWAIELGKRTAATPGTAVPMIGPSWRELKQYPLVILCGQTAMRPLSASEITALARYLTVGGTLVIDSFEPALSARFDQSVRQLVDQLAAQTGGAELAPLKADHVLYRSFYVLPGAVGRVAVGQAVEAAVIGERLGIIYTRCDLLGALLKNPAGAFALPCAPGGEAQREQAMRLAVNISMYALCLDYKNDQAHLPAILERRRHRPQDGATAMP